MLDFKRILVPYDGSDNAKRALKQAAAIAESCDNAKLFIATVAAPKPPTEIIAKEKAYVFEDAKDDPERTDPAQVMLDESVNLLPADVSHELLFRVGNPGSVLLDLAFEKDADLVVMGNRGRGAIQSLIMGSVSSHMVSNVKCPIFVVK